MPSRREIQWSQLKVGALVLVAVAVLVGLIFLMSGTTGGLFAPKLTLRSYFNNASGLKNGAPVTLEGVTIGNVLRIRVVPERNPTPVEVTMRVGEEYIRDLHVNSTTAIAQAGVLGDSYLDIDSSKASGPPPANNSELRATQSPNIQSVISSSQDSIDQISVLLKKLEVTIDAINSGKGTVGALINDRALSTKFSLIADHLEKITGQISNGTGSLGKLINDDSLYTKAEASVDNVNKITAALNQGQGTAGKLLRDETLYNNLNATVSQIDQLVADVNAGKGSIGKLAKDPNFAKKLDDTVSHLDSILNSVDEGKGTIGQLVQNRTVYDHLDQTLDNAQQLLKAIRQDPKKYFVIRLKLF
ncbi:MAG TPA: MlaD family protein [Terracidiphilus sp.]|nr:MlaD family protein [Terracidiphilus sp.]